MKIQKCPAAEVLVNDMVYIGDVAYKVVHIREQQVQGLYVEEPAYLVYDFRLWHVVDAHTVNYLTLRASEDSFVTINRDLKEKKR